jgi:surface polysaccharide O-acyltransferase-like enzyme
MSLPSTVRPTEDPVRTLPAATTERRYDVDWLRIIAVFAVIALHTAVIFSSGLFNVKHPQHSVIIDTIGTWISVWVVPLLFLLAGATTAFALRRRTPQAYRTERVNRLLVPIVAWFVLPTLVAHLFGWDFLYQLPGNPRLAFTVVGTGHLWFIIYLFIFSLVALPLFTSLRTPRGRRAIDWLARFCETPGVIFLLALPVLGISPVDNDNHLLQFFYLIYFIYGFIFFSDARFGRAIDRQTGFALAAGSVLLALTVFGGETHLSVNRGLDWTLAVFDRWCWVIALLGLGHRVLNRSNRMLPYLTEASYPIYILHYLILALIAYLLVGFPWPVEVKYVVILALATGATVAAYDLLVRRTTVTRWLFGMKPRRAGTERTGGERSQGRLMGVQGQ